MMNKISLDKNELPSVVLLAFIFTLRVLGLFIIFPIFSNFAYQEYPGSSPQLIGIALGAYGLTQGLLQIPFGILSDYIGRKKVICLGLSIFIAGSLLATFSTSIYSIIGARILQGCGAIGCVVLASVADSTRLHVRVQAMAIIGISIGGAFILALILGPIIYPMLGLSGIFAFTAFLGLFALVLTLLAPNFKTLATQQKWRQNKVPAAAMRLALIHIYYGVFALHTILAALFLVLPKHLNNRGIFNNCFIVIILASVFLALLAIKSICRSKNINKLIFVNVSGIFISLVMFSWVEYAVYSVILALLIFFSCFNILEAILPALVAEYSAEKYKGMAMGIFSSCQFFGVFIGGVIGGWLIENINKAAVIIFCGCLALIWLVVLIVFTLNKGHRLWQEALIK